jgi:hypothetical protein
MGHAQTSGSADKCSSGNSFAAVLELACNSIASMIISLGLPVLA